MGKKLSINRENSQSNTLHRKKTSVLSQSTLSRVNSDLPKPVAYGVNVTSKSVPSSNSSPINDERVLFENTVTFETDTKKFTISKSENVLTIKSLTENISLRINTEAAKNWKADQTLKNERRPYVLPCDVAEHSRLEIQNLVYNHIFGRFVNMVSHLKLHTLKSLISLSKIPLDQVLSIPNARVLNIGIGPGPGSWANDVAKKYPSAEVHEMFMIKIDSEVKIEQQPNVKFVTGNILEKLPC
ncbi:hypothetical protein HK096_000137 [Nowakowskiella sp. JEL0078]|nr:hypothetical protein HK096_000137 [Nowakowskiella sp. JEL0078]